MHFIGSSPRGMASAFGADFSWVRILLTQILIISTIAQNDGREYVMSITDYLLRNISSVVRAEDS